MAERLGPGLRMETLTHIDLSAAKLSALPGISCLSSLQHLNISVNRFKALPEELNFLTALISLNASRNFLKPTEESLRARDISKLSSFCELDIRFNERCGTRQLFDWLKQELPAVSVKLSLWGQTSGRSPSDRNAGLIRSQIEPWPTPVLRRRLRDFGDASPGLEDLEREEVMGRLLGRYSAAGRERERVRVSGTPVRPALLAELEAELRRWADRQQADADAGRPRERPSISATFYTILRSPGEFAWARSGGSKKARFAAAKLRRNARVWELAMQALGEVDPAFARQVTQLAVTKGFRGSPHIDKQNRGPFYGLALGDFPAGQGGICVECDAWTVGVVNTRHRLGKVDGRFPHWVDAYDSGERYSIIFYQTEGERVPPTTAIFLNEQGSPA